MMNFENILKLGFGIYTPSEISRILRVPNYKVNRWIDKYWDGELGKEFEQRYSWKTNDSKAVSFHTLIEFYIMMELAEAGVKTRKVLEAHKQLSAMYHTPFPFALQEVLSGMHTDGTSVFLQKGEDTITLDVTKQFNLKIVELFFKNLDFEDGQLASRFWPLGKQKSILIDPTRKFGHPVVNGYNIYPETLHNLIKGGESIDYVSFLYDVPINEIQDAIEYCTAA